MSASILLQNEQFANYIFALHRSSYTGYSAIRHPPEEDRIQTQLVAEQPEEGLKRAYYEKA